MDKETHTRILQDAIDEDNLMFLCEREGYKAGLRRAIDRLEQAKEEAVIIGLYAIPDALNDLRAELEAGEGGE